MKNTKSLLGSTQAYNFNNDFKLKGNQLEITSKITTLPKKLINPLQFLLLRMLSLTIFRFPKIKELTKNTNQSGMSTTFMHNKCTFEQKQRTSQKMS